MSNHARFSSHAFTLRRVTMGGGLVLLCVLVAFTAVVWRSHAATSSIRHPPSAIRDLSVEDRIAYQRALEAVYHRHRLWPQDNPTPKPALEAVLPEAALRAKVEDYLRQSNALAQYWQQPLTPEQLQAELERMAQHTQQPAVLRELWAALDNDPFVIAECLARPLLAERELGMRIADCGARNGRCEALGLTKASDPQTVIRTSPFAELSVEVQGTGFEFQLPTIAEAAAPEAACGSDSWAPMSNTNTLGSRSRHTAVWTGSEMIVWGGSPGPNFEDNIGGRYSPATDSWLATSTTDAPSGRGGHTSVWTGTEMIVWGGDRGRVFTVTGGRYNPATNTWIATSTNDAPSQRNSHTVVWTGSEMIVWGGSPDGFSPLDNGRRYNPTTNAWAGVNTANPPSARYAHTAVWTGNEMIVWGGYTSPPSFAVLNTGGKYNPVTDTWTATSLNNAPSPRVAKSVWTGNEMIVWGGGRDSGSVVNTGGRYNPVTNSWTATATTNAPSARQGNTAVWTSSEMIIWGGFASGPGLGLFNSGGRYNPATDTWTTTTTSSAPSARDNHTAVWTGNEMIVWHGDLNLSTNSGGRYSLNLLTLSQTTQSFTASGGSGSVAVTAQGGCTWTATSNANWLATTSSGSGNGTVNFTVAANTSASQRTGTLTIGTQTFTVTQAGAAANVGVSIATTLAAAPNTNIVVPIQVDDVTGKSITAYEFTLSFNPNVLQLQSTPTDAAGTLSSGFSITPNAATAGQLRVAAFGTTPLSGAGTLLKLNFTVIGAAGTTSPLMWQAFGFNEGTPTATTTNGLFTVNNPGPTLTSLSPNSATAGGAGFTLTATGAGFVNGSVVRWNGTDRPTTFVSSTQLTAQIAAADIATAGSASVTVFNPAPGGGTSTALSFTINSSCTYTLTPTSQAFNSNGGTGTVNIATGNGCVWVANADAIWITITTSKSGVGNGSIGYEIAANTGTSARTGIITISGQTFTVNQAANVCSTITLAPANLPDGMGGTMYTQTLTASGGAAPYGFTVSAGALPGGLTLSTNGVLAGTPNAAGTFNFTVTATDANNCTGTRSYTVNITAPPLGAQTRALYVLRDSTSGNQIYGYAVNETTGALTLLPGFPLSTGYNGGGFSGNEQLTIDRVNQRLYAINRGANRVTAYSINPLTGALAPLSFSPINLGSGNWVSVAVHPSGSTLVVGDVAGIFGDGGPPKLLSYRITATNATATLGSPYILGGARPLSMTFSQDGRFIYIGGGSDSNNNIAGFNVNAETSQLTALVGSPFDSGNTDPTACATDITGRLFVANFGAGQIRTFTTTNGILSSVSGNPFTSGLSVAQSGILHPNGFYLVSDSANRIGVYRINGNGNATTLPTVTGSPFVTGGTSPMDLALNQAGTFLFAANGDSRNLTILSVNPTTGALTALSTQPVNTLGTSGNLTGMAYFAAPCPATTLSPATLPSGTAGTAYNQTVTASPAGNYNYSVTAGALPAGLSLNATTGAITGTPTSTGTANFTITALSFGPCSGSQAYTISIQSSCPTVTGINPSSSSVGATVTISGTNFTGVNAVKFANNLTAQFTVVSDTQITAIVPTGAVMGPITISKASCADVQTGVFTVSALLPTLSFNGKARDRVGADETVLNSDGALDGTFTVVFPAGSGSRTITGLDLVRSAGGRWNTVPGDGLWVVGAASSLDAPLHNDSTGRVNFTVADGGRFTLFASDNNNSLFNFGDSFTLTINFADGTTTRASGTVQTLAFTLSFNGKSRDRVGMGETALTADGLNDGVFTVTLPAGSGARTVTGLDLARSGGGRWNTVPGDGLWVVGAANALDGQLHNGANGSVNFPVSDGGSFLLFASDNGNALFVSGSSFTLTVSFADGSAATATVTVRQSLTLTLAFNGKVRDRVGAGETVLSADGQMDGVFTVGLPTGSGSRTVTGLNLVRQGGGQWNTTPGDGLWVVGAASSLDATLANDPTGRVNFTVADGGSFLIFASDSGNALFNPVVSLTLTVTFADGTSADAFVTVNASPLTLTFSGKTRDRVGMGETALTADGFNDGVFTVTLPSSGSTRTVTSLDLVRNGGGRWNTVPGDGLWVVGAANALDGQLHNSATGAVSFPVSDGGSFLLFASDNGNALFVPGSSFTLLINFANGTTATGNVTVTTSLEQAGN